VAVTLAEVTALVRSAAEGMLGETLPLDGAFVPGAFDSLSAVELANAVSAAVGRDLPSTLVFDYPSVAAMAAYVSSLLTPAVELPTSVIAPVRLPAQLTSAPQTGLYGGSAVGLEVAERCPLSSEQSLPHGASGHGGDLISTLPYERWDIDAPKDGRSTLRVRFGGFVAGLERFDAAAFGITPPEAQLMDPQQRLLMEVRLATSQLVPRNEHWNESAGGSIKARVCIQALT
jgi:acyl carrier protein